MLLLQVEKEVKSYLRKHPGCRFIDLVRGTGNSRGVIHRCIEDLTERGEVAVKEVRRKVFRYYPQEKE